MRKRNSAAESLDEVLAFEDETYSFSSRGPRLKRLKPGNEWIGIVDTLCSEHEYILFLLQSLERQASKLKPGKIPDYQLLLETIDYLMHYPAQFHHPREDLLFSALLRRDKKFQSRLTRLRREHATLQFYNDKLYNELTGIVNGRRADRPQLLNAISKFVSGYRKHLAYETSEIFPLARGKLSAKQLEKIEAKTRFIDDPLFGSEVKRQYRRLGRTLQAGLGSASEIVIAKELSSIEPAIENLSSLFDKFTELRKSVSLPGSESWRERLNTMQAYSPFGPGPSWQARVMNTCMRTMVKPLMRFGSVQSIRGLTGGMDARGESILAEDIRSRLVKKSGYKGEWVRLAGKRARKTILYFPGGGFIMRTPTGHKAFVAKICRAAGARALIVHYSLAPEIPFPGGLENCLAAYHDLLSSGCKARDITLAGDSAGGGLVLSTLLALRDEGSPLPASAIVLSPLADLTYSGGSREFNKCRDPMLPTHRASEMHHLYIGEALPEDRFISPIFADFDGLPPILGQVGSTEILLDDTLRAAARARDAGVTFFLEVWEQMPHVFPIFGVLPESQIAIERMADFIKQGKLQRLPDKYAANSAQWPHQGRV